MKRDTLARLLEAQARGLSVVVATRLSDGAQELLTGERGSSSLAVTAGQIDEAIRSDESTVVGAADGDVLLRPYTPPPRLLIVGAVHIAQALVGLADAVGLETTVIDPREGFATEERFPGAALVREWPDKVLTSGDLDRRTALVALTHDPKIDDPALQIALESSAFYIGALGGRKTQAERRQRLSEAGFPAVSLDRIHGPIGLPIGARSPEEIAVAVLGQVIDALRNPDEAPLSR